MLFFDDKLLLKYSGVTGNYLALWRAVNANDNDNDIHVVIDNFFAATSAGHDAAAAAHDYLADYAIIDISYRKRAKLFKPFESISDAALSVLSIVSAPICLTLLALDEMLSCIVSSLKFIANLVMLDPDAANESILDACMHYLEACKVLFFAVVSPAVNTVDFIGSCVATLTTETDENSEIPSAMNP